MGAKFDLRGWRSGTREWVLMAVQVFFGQAGLCWLWTKSFQLESMMSMIEPAIPASERRLPSHLFQKGPVGLFHSCLRQLGGGAECWWATSWYIYIYIYIYIYKQVLSEACSSEKKCTQKKNKQTWLVPPQNKNQKRTVGLFVWRVHWCKLCCQVYAFDGGLGADWLLNFRWPFYSRVLGWIGSKRLWWGSLLIGRKKREWSFKL